MDDSTVATSEESGSTLRTRLEEALKANKELGDANKALSAEVVITRSGLTLVKPADLAGVETDQLAAKAAEIEATRTAEREQMFIAEAARRGITLTPSIDATTPVVNSALNRVASLGSLGGVPPAQVKHVPVTADELLDVALG